jgi:hypothetical protein
MNFTVSKTKKTIQVLPFGPVHSKNDHEWHHSHPDKKIRYGKIQYKIIAI